MFRCAPKSSRVSLAPLAPTIVARSSNCCEAPALPRMFHHPFLEPRCTYCASETAHLHAHRSLHGPLGRWVYLPSWPFFFEARTIQWIALSRPCKPRLFNVFNYGFHKTKKTDMSQITHTLLLSLAAGRLASSPSDAYKNKSSSLVLSTQPFRVLRGANTCIHDGTCAQGYTRRQLCWTG